MASSRHDIGQSPQKAAEHARKSAIVLRQCARRLRFKKPQMTQIHADEITLKGGDSPSLVGNALARICVFHLRQSASSAVCPAWLSLAPQPM
jgi:hypothetical protein